MDSEGPTSSTSDLSGRGLDIAVWVLVVSALVGVAAAVAWFLSGASIELREITYEDESVEFELIPPAPAPQPVPVSPAPTPAEGASAAREEGADGVARVRWARQPAPYFPELAARKGIARGVVRLRCETYASGRIGDCAVLSETPAGVGFAEAALASMRDARVLPRSSEPTDSRIRFTIRFIVDTGL